MAATAFDGAGSSTIVLLLNMRPCNKGTDDGMDSIKYVPDSGGPGAASTIKALGGGKLGRMGHIDIAPAWCGRTAPPQRSCIKKPLVYCAASRPPWCPFQTLSQCGAAEE